jgi:hypothetical protein
MSHAIDETYDVYSETFHRARKAHRCCACDSTIRRGDRYARIFLIFQRDPELVLRCLRCQTIHKHLRDLDPGATWPAERLDCGEEYAEHWGKQPPAEIAEIAFMTDDEAQQRLAP